jgi:hypothetical protein
MSGWKRIWLTFIAVCLGIAASFSQDVLETELAPPILQGHPTMLKIGLLAVAACLQTWIAVGSTPKVNVLQRLLLDFHTDRYSQDPSFRVTILKVSTYRFRLLRNTWAKRPKWLSLWLPRGEILPPQFLSVLCRAPDEASTSTARFRKNEGTAGMAWVTRKTWISELPDPDTDGDAWLLQSVGLTKETAAKLTRKCMVYVCVPLMSCSDRHAVRGILSVDSLKKPMTTPQIKEVERFAKLLSNHEF